MDRLLGIAADRISVGVRQMCCEVAIGQPGFARAAEHLENLAQIKISPERIRVATEAEGQKVLKVQGAGLLPAAFCAQDCTDGLPGHSRIYVGADGLKIPMVTAAEKAKRRKGRRRSKRSRSQRRMHRGADNAYKEFKIALIYDQSNERRQVVATSGNHEVLGRLMRREASRVRLCEADEKIAIVDGADWIAKQLNGKLPMLDGVILDFYHLSEHVWSVANKCFGQDSDEAKEYAGRLLHIAKHDGVAGVLTGIELERNRHSRGVKRKALDELMGYVGSRAGMCDYPTYVSKDWDIGSGPTEAMCKVLAYRLKGPGMRWDKYGADAMMALAALRQSNTWKTYWDAQKHAA